MRKTMENGVELSSAEDGFLCKVEVVSKITGTTGQNRACSTHPQKELKDACLRNSSFREISF